MTQEYPIKFLNLKGKHVAYLSLNPKDSLIRGTNGAFYTLYEIFKATPGA